ncbi:MAG: hypothetical protein ACYDEN_01460 [Acidimicrobiales bacterium]
MTWLLAFTAAPPAAIASGNEPGQTSSDPQTTLGTVTFAVDDSDGNVLTGATAAVKVSLIQLDPVTMQPMTSPTWNLYSPTNTLSAQPVAGVATFPDLKVTGPGYVELQATDGDSTVTAAPSSP